ncbi:MAG: CapA family protein [Clostridiales Family XIII bacterium]|jgi:poly-gamma-glutamate synthesis protein (capsule biosynthesis protein)|nr:CapA family protein [Clostridiales Family XIII bacterium]
MAGLLSAILLSFSCAEYGGTRSADGPEKDPSSAEAEAPEAPVSLRILCAGDVMVHAPQLTAQRNDTTGVYDFANNFDSVMPYVAGADLAFCNLETTLGGEPYTGYPTFSSPDDLAGALSGAGFDAVFTSNNHMLDRGAAGLRRTLEVARAAGLVAAGSRLSEDEPASPLLSREGLDVGLVAFTYESPRAGASRTLNGIRISDELRPLINSFGYEDLDGDLERVDGEIRRARAAGAEIVVCYFHWGTEYQLSPNGYQEYIASRAAISGADIIFASHPHVPQGMEYLYPSEDRAVPVFYSLGNFISNQRAETTGSLYTEQGLMAVVDLRFARSEGRISQIDARVLPTWVDKYRSGGKSVYAIVPLTGDFENNPALLASGHAERARLALAYCEELFGEAALYRDEAAGTVEADGRVVARAERKQVWQ